jgi:hypothetical protein
MSGSPDSFRRQLDPVRPSADDLRTADLALALHPVTPRTMPSGHLQTLEDDPFSWQKKTDLENKRKISDEEYGLFLCIL